MLVSPSMLPRPVAFGMALMLGAAFSVEQRATPVPTPSASVVPRPLDCPAPPGSQTPNLAPTPDGGVLLSWVESRPDGTRALAFSSRREGTPWSEPRQVASGRDWFTNWADFPSLASLSDGNLAAHWLQKAGHGSSDYEVRLSRSTDQGRSWSPSVRPHRATPGEHGFVSLMPRSGGRLDVVWLDGRAMKDGAGATALMRRTFGRDFEPGDEQVLDPRTCDCCQTAAAVTGADALVVYRDRAAGELRDISSVRLAAGRAAEPRELSRDGWEINGCPVNGPGVSASGAEVAVAWFTGAGGRSLVRLAFSSDGGATFAAPLTVSEARPLGRVDVVALPGGEAFVSWLERIGEGAELRLQRFGSRGAMGPVVRVTTTGTARQSGFPRLERAGRELVLAWTETTNPPRVRTASVAF